MLFFGVGVRLGRLHCSIAMPRRRIDRIEPERLVARVDDIVPGSRRHDDSVVTLDLRSMPVDPDLALAFFHAEELIAISMGLLTDLVTD